MEQRHDGQNPVSVAGRDDLELAQLVALGDDVVMA